MTRAADSPNCRFGMIPATVVESTVFAQLPATAVKVLVILMLHADGRTRRCRPSRRLISRLAGLHPCTVTACLRTLESRGLITVDRRNGCRSRYTLHDVPTGCPSTTGSVGTTGCPGTTGTGSGATTGPVAQGQLHKQNREQNQQQSDVVVDARPKETQPEENPARRDILARLIGLGLVGPKLAQIANHPKITLDLIDMARSNIGDNGAANPAGLLVRALESRLGLAEGTNMETEEIREARRIHQEREACEVEERRAQDREIMAQNAKWAVEVDTILDQLSDADIAKLRAEILEGIERPFLRDYHGAPTIQELRNGDGVIMRGWIAKRAVANGSDLSANAPERPTAHAAGRLFGSD